MIGCSKSAKHQISLDLLAWFRGYLRIYPKAKHKHVMRWTTSLACRKRWIFEIVWLLSRWWWCLVLDQGRHVLRTNKWRQFIAKSSCLRVSAKIWLKLIWYKRDKHWPDQDRMAPWKNLSAKIRSEKRYSHWNGQKCCRQILEFLDSVLWLFGRTCGKRNVNCNLASVTRIAQVPNPKALKHQQYSMHVRWTKFGLTYGWEQRLSVNAAPTRPLSMSPMVTDAVNVVHSRSSWNGTMS